MTALPMVLGSGMLLGLGLFFVIAGTRRGTVALGDALASLDGTAAISLPEPPAPDERLEGLGWWLHTRLRLPVTDRQRQLLMLQGRTVADFFVEKAVLSFTGFALPVLWVALAFLLDRPVSATPLVLSLLGAVAGYFLADARLARGGNVSQRSATESVHTFFDLVALERLANQSATQAVTSAAEISDAPLFRRITAGLDRARMEQVSPWGELRRIADEWWIPELADFADVMQLEEQGAALADVLQARVKELRDAHLAEQRARAQETTEGLSIWMTLPALLLGVAFVVPPLLKLTGL